MFSWEYHLFQMDFGNCNRRSVFRSTLQSHRGDYRSDLVRSCKDSLDYVQRLGLLYSLPVHSGCVNTVHWNRSGEYLISGSDDQFISITNPHNQKILFKYKSGHRANIFSARFMPQSNDQAIVSCSGDGIVLHTELLAPYVRKNKGKFSNCPSRGVDDANMSNTYERITEKEANIGCFNCHKTGTTYEVLTVPSESKSFMSCGEDGTVRWFDLRQISSCHKTCCKDNILIFSPSAVNAIDLAPINNHYLAVGSSDAVVRVYDRRYLSVIDFRDNSVPTTERHTRPLKTYPIPLTTKKQYRITCVRYSPEESELLVSYSSEYLYLFNTKHNGIEINDQHQESSEEEQQKDCSNNNAMTSDFIPEIVTRRLRLRGDWSDTGPDARPENESTSGRVESGQFRPQLQANIMSRMTEVISRMLNDPRTRLGLSSHIQDNQNRAAQSQTSRRYHAYEGTGFEGTQQHL